jgi:hypothetical protein
METWHVFNISKAYRTRLALRIIYCHTSYALADGCAAALALSDSSGLISIGEKMRLVICSKAVRSAVIHLSALTGMVNSIGGILMNGPAGVEMRISNICSIRYSKWHWLWCSSRQFLGKKLKGDLVMDSTRDSLNELRLFLKSVTDFGDSFRFRLPIGALLVRIEI